MYRYIYICRYIYVYTMLGKIWLSSWIYPLIYNIHAHIQYVYIFRYVSICLNILSQKPACFFDQNNLGKMFP